MAVKYSTESGIVVTALKWSSTIIPMVVDGFEFWALLLITSTVSILKQTEIFNPEEYDLDIPFGLTGVTGSLMTFFVCFYNGHVFGRYNKLYALTRQMTDTCLEIASAARLDFDKTTQRRITKFAVGSCFMFFFQRSTHHDVGSAVSEEEYSQLRALELLSDAEIDVLKKHCNDSGQEAMPSAIILEWGMQAAVRVTEDETTRDDMLQSLIGNLYNLRKVQFDIQAIMELPMPFQYFHIMNLMLSLNLFFWAISLGCTDSVFGPVIYTFVQMMFQGVRELSTALSDPFGDDEVDFPVNEWMHSLYATCYGVLEDKFDVATMLSISGDKPLKDPNHARRKINMLVDLHSPEGLPHERRIAWRSRRSLPAQRPAHDPLILKSRDRAQRHVVLHRELASRNQRWIGLEPTK